MNFLLTGRPNVGKSSIYNKLIGLNDNIVHSYSGTTRDWHRSKFFYQNYFIYDTPGIILNAKSNEKFRSFDSLLKIISKIDVLFFVIDFNTIFDPIDLELIKKVKKYKKDIILLINKFDNLKKDINNDYFKYGIQKVFFISCAHNYGFEKLNEFLQNKYQSNKTIFNEFDYSFAIFGKPNSGKSTFVNSLLGYERSFTSSISGTTSDFVTDFFKYKSKKYKIFDTAGIARSSKIKNSSILDLSVKKSLSKINNVDAALILIDSSKGVDRQDKRIINLISNYAKNLIIILNKKDLIKNFNKFKKDIIIDIENNLHQIKNIKIFFCSALLKKDVYKILEYIHKNIFLKQNKISTGKLNNWLKNVIKNKEHPLINNKKVKFKYIVKIKDNPMTLKIFSNFSKKIRPDYQRYLINNFNKIFKITNQKTKIVFSKSENPFK